MYKFILLLTPFLFTINLQAQSEIGYGFRAGMSFSKIDGPSELGPNGEELENNKMAAGFHIGVALNYKFTDLMGMRGEFLYSQRGTDYTYDGPSYYMLRGTTPLTIFGHRRQTINVSNAFIDIPVMLYYKIGYFELSAGLNTGLLISSTAVGNIEFEGVSPLGTNIAPFEINLSHNYKKDDAGYASTEMNPVNVDGKTYQIPEFVGAYYDFSTKDKDLYNSLDFGLTFGLAYFLNDGLYLSAKYIHGLGDVDRNYYDHSLQNLENGSVIQRADVNKSKSWQFSIGFSF